MGTGYGVGDTGYGIRGTGGGRAYLASGCLCRVWCSCCIAASTASAETKLTWCMESIRVRVGVRVPASACLSGAGSDPGGG